MNNSIQQEIAAPKACKASTIVLFVVFNFFIIGAAFALLLLKEKGIVAYFSDKGITLSLAPLLVGFIVADAIVVAVIVRKQYSLLMIALILAALDCAALLIYHSASKADKSMVAVWQIVTISVSFATIIFALILLWLFYADSKERKNPIKNVTKYLTYCAMFTALSVICKLIGNAITAAIPFAGLTLKLTIVYIAWVLAGIVIGPIGGFAAAAIGDFIGQLALNVGGMPLPLLTLSNGLFAVFPALVYKLLKLKDIYLRAIIAILVGTIISALICTLGISTYALYTSINTGYDSFFAYFVARLPQTLVIAINIVIMIIMSPALIKAKLIKAPSTLFFD